MEIKRCVFEIEEEKLKFNFNFKKHIVELISSKLESDRPKGEHKELYLKKKMELQNSKYENMILYANIYKYF